MSMTMLPHILWIVLAVYGLFMFWVSPTAKRFGEFFVGRRADGRDVGVGLLIGSVVISWIFAKSITNAANLGERFGLVGAVAYAGWYMSIPVAGVIIYRIRRRAQVRSLAEFLTGKYGRAATGAFMLVVLLRLFNEVWSNTAVVGSYFGPAGSRSYFGAAMVFAALTLAYTLRGGLRSSILTDGIQFGLGIFLLVFILGLIVPQDGAGRLMSAGTWTLAGGVDLLLVALLQSFSYPFHDPVLTDRAFITDPKKMLAGYLWAGAIAGAFIVLFGLVGVHAQNAGLEVVQDAPLRVARSFGLGTLVVTTVLMMVSAGSTLDSTLSSFSKAVVMDIGGEHGDHRDIGLTRRLTQWISQADPLRVGRALMVLVVVVGSLPLFAGATILKATTVSGTMVLGLAPAFLFFAWGRARGYAFHLGFWPGLLIGVIYAAGRVPESWGIGSGAYTSLLGANVYGTLIVFTGFAVGAVLDSMNRVNRVRVVTAVLAAAVLAGGASLARAEDAAPRDEGLRFHGQTMFRLTMKMRDLDRPAAEVYNVRLLAERSFAPYRFLTELRFRQTPLRSYSPSNVWLQQAYIAANTPVEGLTAGAGLIYNQLGLFWDGSWFGNLPYLNGHKLDPDMNLELAFAHEWNEVWAMKAWVQASPGEDGLNGSFVTAKKRERLLLPADLEADPLYREAAALRLRAVVTWTLGGISLSPGGSVQLSAYDRTATESAPAATGGQRVAGAELAVVRGHWSFFAEALSERVRDLAERDLDRTYYLAGGAVTLRAAPDGRVPLVRAGASWQHTRYRPEDFHESFFTARLHARLHPVVGVTAEYVRWTLTEANDPELDRVELILHAYY